MRVVFVVVVLALGQLAGALSVRLWGPPGGAEQVILPVWAFGLVWLVLYPCFAAASVRIWEQRARPEGPATLACGLCALAVILAFMPISCASQRLEVTVMLDLLGWITGWAAGFAYGRVSREALLWMGPLLVWMPLTFAIKLAAAL